MSETLENLVRAEAREGGTHGTACLVRLTRLAHSRPVSNHHLTLLTTHNKQNSLSLLNIFLVAYFSHVVHCKMHRKTATPSFGFVSSARTMSCCATTTRSSFVPLFRYVSHMVLFRPLPSLRLTQPDVGCYPCSTPSR